jgi:hypothetical protein
MEIRITETERRLGRPENFHHLSKREQWEIDEKLGILDWDGTKEEADKILAKTTIQRNPNAGEILELWPLNYSKRDVLRDICNFVRVCKRDDVNPDERVAEKWFKNFGA